MWIPRGLEALEIRTYFSEYILFILDLHYVV